MWAGLTAGEYPVPAGIPWKRTGCGISAVFAWRVKCRSSSSSGAGCSGSVPGTLRMVKFGINGLLSGDRRNMNEPDHNLKIRFEELCRTAMEKHEVLKHFSVLTGDDGAQLFLEPFSLISCCMSFSDDEIEECIQMLARIGKNAGRTDWPPAKFYLIIALIILRVKNHQLYDEYTTDLERSYASKVVTWFEQWKPDEGMIDQFTKHCFDMLEVSLYFTDTDPNISNDPPAFIQLQNLIESEWLTDAGCLSERTRCLSRAGANELFTLMKGILEHPEQGRGGTQKVTANTIRNVVRLMELS